MSTLVLVRHGQASFGTDNYDRLSDLGHRQSRMLGEYWAARTVGFDQSYEGPLVRHRETATGARMADTAARIPESAVLQGLGEFNWDGLMAYAVAGAARPGDHLGELATAFAAAEGKQEKLRRFQALFEAACRAWTRDEVDPDAIEPWAHFEARTVEALEEMKRGADRGGRVVAFTSGGPIAVALRQALDIPAEKALELIWTLRNAAVNEFVFTPTRFSLHTFNTVAHLDAPDLWTHR